MSTVTSVSDISNLDTGFYIYYGVGPVEPTYSTYYFVINTKYGTGYITQMLISLSSSLIYMRKQSEGTWSEFQIVPTNNSLASASASSVNIDAFSAVHFDMTTGKFFVYIDGVRHDIASY